MNNHTATALVLAALTVSAAQSVPYLRPSSPRTQAAAVHPSDYVRIESLDGPFTVPAGKILVVKQLHHPGPANYPTVRLTIDGDQVARIVERDAAGDRTGPFQFSPGITAVEGSIVQVLGSDADDSAYAFGYLVDAN